MRLAMIKQTNKQNGEIKMSIWNNIPDNEAELDASDRSFVLWNGNTPNVLTFETNEPREGVNKFGKNTYYFDVLNVETKENQVLGVSSTKLMIQLKNIGIGNEGLAGLTVAISRNGSGYDTVYNVTVVRD